MSKILIKGTNVYDGAWDFDPGYFTNGEYHRIKQISDVRAGELRGALAAGDVGLIVALAAVALERHGKHVDIDVLWNAKDVPEMEDEAEPEADDVLPPVNAGGESSGPDEKSSSSAQASANGSENPETIPAATGAGSSASSASAPAISPTSPPTS